MSPEQQKIIQALLMQQNQGSQGDIGGFMTEYAYPDGTAIMRAPKGQRYADQLFRTHPDGTGSQLDSTDLQEFVPGAKTAYRPADKSSQAYDFPQNEAARARPRPPQTSFDMSEIPPAIQDKLGRVSSLVKQEFIRAYQDPRNRGKNPYDIFLSVADDWD